MTDTPRSLDAILAGLSAALRLHRPDFAGALLVPLRDKGLAHDHVRITGTGVLARIPKQSQMDLPAAENLDYQAACFRRAAPSGHTPGLVGVLLPTEALPHGALLVEEIMGVPVELPRDLPSIAVALACIHALPLPPPAERPPLLDAADSLAGLLAEIDAQAVHLPAARLEPGAAAAIEAELAGLRRLCAAPARPARHLISFDAHPGNFLRREDGSAVLVDLEKARYAHPSLDLAHATLYTSTTWDVDSHAVLEPGEIAAFYASWAAVFGPGADAIAPWHVKLRRAMWLWSVTWCAKWRVLSASGRKGSADGEDWSAEASDSALIAHVQGRVDHYLSPPVIARIIAEFAALERLIGA